MGNAEKREKPEDRFFVKASQGTEFGYDDDLNDIVDFELEDPDSGVEGAEPPPPEIVELITRLRACFGAAQQKLRCTMDGYGIPDTWQDEVDKTMESVGKELEDSFEAVLQNRRFRMLVMGPSNAGKTTLIRYVTGASCEYQKRSTTDSTTQWHHVEGTNWTVLDTVGLEVGDDASLRDLRRKISHKLPDVILVALSLRDQRRWSDPNFEATKLLKTQLSMVQNVFMRQTGNKCRAPIVWVATQLDEARDDEFNCKRGTPWETWTKDITSEFDTVLQVITPHFKVFADAGFDSHHLCVTAIDVDEGETFGVDQAGGLLDRISSQSGIVAMVHNNDFHRYYVSSRRALAMKIIASFSGIAGVIGLIPLVDIPLTFIVGDIMLSVLECLKLDEKKSVEEYKERYATGLAVSNTATVAMFVAGMVLDFTVLGIVAGEAVGATTAVSSITALGVHAYDYFTEEEAEAKEGQEGDSEGKTVEELQKGVFDFVLSSSKERQERDGVKPEGDKSIDSKGKEEGLGRIFSYLNWKKQPVEVQVYKGEEEELLAEDSNKTEPEEKHGDKEVEKSGFFSFLSWGKSDASTTEEEEKIGSEVANAKEGIDEKPAETKKEWSVSGLQQDIIKFVKRDVEDGKSGEKAEEEVAENTENETEPKEGLGGLVSSFLQRSKAREEIKETETEEKEDTEAAGGPREEKKEGISGLFSSFLQRKGKDQANTEEGKTKEANGEKDTKEERIFGFLQKSKEPEKEKKEGKPSLFSSIPFFSRNPTPNASNNSNKLTDTKIDDSLDLSSDNESDGDSSLSEVKDRERKASIASQETKNADSLAISSGTESEAGGKEQGDEEGEGGIADVSAPETAENSDGDDEKALAERRTEEMTN